MNTQRNRQELGFTMIEMVVAMGVLAVAGVLAVRLVGISRQSDRNANDRLVRTLAVDNAAAQLRWIPYDAIAETAESIRESSGLTIERRPFESQRTRPNQSASQHQSAGQNQRVSKPLRGDKQELRKGTHLVIRSTSDTGTVTHQLWRWAPNQ